MKYTETVAPSDDLLVNLLEAPVPISASVPPVEEPQHHARATVSKPRIRSGSPAPRVVQMYERVGKSIALLGSLAIAIGLWAAGAWFTLQFLASIGVALAGIGYWQWLIPITVTATELFLWPHKSTRIQQIGVFLAVLAFDIGTTYAGLAEVAAGRTIPLFSGIPIPHNGPLFVVLGLGCGLLFAFGPEKIGKWAISDLYALWRA